MQKDSQEVRKHRRFVHWAFGVTTVISVILLAIGSFRDVPTISNWLITACMLAFFWYWSLKSKTTRTAVAAALFLILVNALGAALNAYDFTVAGTRYDTYLHIIGGFVAMLLATEWLHDAQSEDEKDALLKAAFIVVILSVGVEIVELADVTILHGEWMTGCWNGACEYWLDTAKDLVNDALGIAFFLVARTSRRELLKI